MAASYASYRPPVHLHVMRLLAEMPGIARPRGRALDLGCGAGHSTAALAVLAGSVVGLDPAAAMLAHSRGVARQASFVLGQAEALPFRNRAFDLIAAAGSINYADVDSCLAETNRVLSRDGTFIIYDFGAGRTFRGGTGLDEWFGLFEQRYPFPPGYALDVRTLPYDRLGLILKTYREFEAAISVNVDLYVRYLSSEANIEQAIRRGIAEPEIRAWCVETLSPLFGSGTREVLFPGYVACVEVQPG